MGHNSFSIVIPAHNGERFLRSAISSALGQSRKADEIILVDDASTDGTAKIAREYGDRVRYFLNPGSSGFVDAWNRAVEKATGDFVTILHQDDLLHPGYLENVEKALKRFPQARHCYAACNYIDEQGNVTRTPPEPLSLEPILYPGREYARKYLDGVIANRHIHRCPGVTTSRKLLLSECLYRKEAGHIADDDFFLRIGAFTDVTGISQPLASYREHRESETSKVDSLALRLAEAYLFQARYYLKPTPLLNADDIRKINSLTVRFVNLLLYQGLTGGRQEWVSRAFALREELDEILPFFMATHLPVWGKIMWALVSPKGHNLLAKSYAKSLYGSMRVRDWLKAHEKME